MRIFGHRDTWKDYLTLKSVNPIIRILIISDFFVLSAFGLFGPIFAIFINNNIAGGTIEVIGIAEALFLVSKGAFQIPVASYIDNKKGEKDDFYALFIGSIIYSLIPLLYLIISKPWHLFIVQIIFGIATAFTLPSWYALFTRHVDKNHEGIEWGIYRTYTEFGGALAASVGGYLAYNYGFNNLFIIVTVISLAGVLLLSGAYRQLKKKFTLIS